MKISKIMGLSPTFPVPSLTSDNADSLFDSASRFAAPITESLFYIKINNDAQMMGIKETDQALRISSLILENQT